MSGSYSTFGYWLVTIGLLSYGGVFLIFRNRIGDPAIWFAKELRDKANRSRLEIVLDRRREIEGFSPSIALVLSGMMFILSLCTALRLLVPIIAFRLAMCASSAALCFAYLRTGNMPTLRVASLTAKPAVIKPLWYALAALASLTPIVYSTVPALRVSSWLVSLASVGIVAAALASASMPAILTGEDLPLEAAVDECVRRCRALYMLYGAYLLPGELFSLAANGIAPSTVWQPLTWLACNFLSCAFLFGCALPEWRRPVLDLRTQ